MDSLLSLVLFPSNTYTFICVLYSPFLSFFLPHRHHTPLSHHISFIISSLFIHHFIISHHISSYPIHYLITSPPSHPPPQAVHGMTWVYFVGSVVTTFLLTFTNGGEMNFYAEFAKALEEGKGIMEVCCWR